MVYLRSMREGKLTEAASVQVVAPDLEVHSGQPMAHLVLLLTGTRIRSFRRFEVG